MIAGVTIITGGNDFRGVAELQRDFEAEACFATGARGFYSTMFAGKFSSTSLSVHVYYLNCSICEN